MAFLAPTPPDPVAPKGESVPPDPISRIRRTRLGRIPIHPGSEQAMLSVSRPEAPAWAPRMHAGPRAPDGSIEVLDRATGERFVIHTPRFEHEFAAGARAFLWYVRSADGGAGRPSSVAFPTAKAALAALERGLARAKAAEPPQKTGKRLRVIWSTP